MMAHRNFDQEKHMNAIETFKMDKGVISVRSLSEESDEKAYWHAKTPHERLKAVELMRQINYGYDPATTRIQRVLEVVQLKQNKQASEGHKDLDN